MLRLVFVFLLFLTTPSLAHQAASAPDLSGRVAERLRNRIEAAGIPPKISVGQDLVHATVALPQFYEQRAYRPAWSGNDGPLPRVEILLQALREAGREGLRPEDYHLARAETIVATLRQGPVPDRPGALADLDLLLTDAFMIYGSHLLSGLVNPETIDAEWLANRRGADFARVLQDALDAEAVRQTLDGLLPPQPGYGRLKKALAYYRTIQQEGGWSTVPAGPKLAKNDRGERVVALRNRLIAAGDLQPGPGEPDLFDEHVEAALRTFQKRQGLDVDGVVGPQTLKALNVPVQTRLQQVRLNMERWRWLPQDLGARHVLVNIANFELDVVEEDRVALLMRVVVGRPYRRTPVFSDRITYLVFSPYWHVPPMIATQDMLPQLRNNPGYLSDKRIRVFEGWGADARQLDPAAVNWSAISAKSFPYRFRQDPGPANALGQVKFMFPNKFNVYLHDTPARDLFQKTSRIFSSGCIRVEKPLDLAEYLLREDGRWNRETIRAAMEKDAEQTVRLPRPVPVHLLYWTAWADETGRIQFREDIYGRDTLLAEALGETHPSAGR